MTLDELRELLKQAPDVGPEIVQDFTYLGESPGYPFPTLRLAHMSDEELGPLWAQFLIEREE